MVAEASGSPQGESGHGGPRRCPVQWGPSLGPVTPVDDLFSFISAAPSPYHAAAEATDRLTSAGFVQLDATAAWPAAPGAYLVADGGSVVAWVGGASSTAPFRVLGAHTDSPNLRLKPRPDTGGHGWKQLGVEVYGGALWNSWLDRDLGLSGRVMVGDGADQPLLVHLDEALCRVPQLAVHLDRDVNTKGVVLNPQQHLTPIWGLGVPDEGEFVHYLAQVISDHHGRRIDPDQIRSWDLMLHDLTPPRLLGRQQDLIASARLDNLVSCWASVEALVRTAQQGSPPSTVAVACLYDHEEVGSTSATGADSVLLSHILERSVLARGGSREDFLRALAGSSCISADMAHAVHPNYPERHDPEHSVQINAGPVIKVNANQRYATEASTAAAVVRAAAVADVPHQWFVGRNDQPCGSTIGPTTAARLGMPTVDVGVAQLSMHSARELCGADDPERLVALMTAFLPMDGPLGPP